MSEDRSTEDRSSAERTTAGHRATGSDAYGHGSGGERGQGPGTARAAWNHGGPGAIRPTAARRHGGAPA
ncbi:hypothetical protein, partial [Streptomyces sp. YIM 98790]|uniref:hypothetical protein n=1 Tax=Streptomyces sp. YIM 98790 TaxID=2689077 RepID=UPI001A9E802F